MNEPAAGSIARLIAERIRDVPDFPTPGVLFRDLAPLLADGPAFRQVVDALVERWRPEGIEAVVGIEARGFLLAAAMGYATGTGVVMVRKAGKLPGATVEVSYQLEYGSASLAMHTDAFGRGARVLVVDDVLATGGTAQATLGLVERLGGHPVGLSVLIELAELGGRDRLAPRDVHALLTL